MSFRVFCPKLAEKWPLKWAQVNSKNFHFCQITTPPTCWHTKPLVTSKIMLWTILIQCVVKIYVAISSLFYGAFKRNYFFDIPLSNLIHRLEQSWHFQDKESILLGFHRRSSRKLECYKKISKSRAGGWLFGYIQSSLMGCLWVFTKICQPKPATVKSDAKSKGQHYP